MESRDKKISKTIPFIMAVPSIILGIYIYMGSTIIPLTVAKITLKIGKRKPWVLFGGIIGSIALICMGA